MPSTKSSTAAASSAAGLSADILINDIVAPTKRKACYLIVRCTLDHFRWGNIEVFGETSARRDERCSTSEVDTRDAVIPPVATFFTSPASNIVRFGRNWGI
jgi:hypothetical protein